MSYITHDQFGVFFPKQHGGQTLFDEIMTKTQDMTNFMQGSVGHRIDVERVEVTCIDNQSTVLGSGVRWECLRKEDAPVRTGIWTVDKSEDSGLLFFYQPQGDSQFHFVPRLCCS